MLAQADGAVRVVPLPYAHRMAELDFAFISDLARVKAGSLDALSIGVDMITALSFPAAVQVVLVVKIALMEHDCGSTHRLEAIVQDTDGKRLTEVTLNVQAAWPGDPPPLDRVCVQALLPLLLPISGPGAHSIDLALDGNPLKTISLDVSQGEAPLG